MKGTILIASSALSSRKLRLLTQREETDVFFCKTSREALEYLIKQTPDFVVLDQNLESVSGLDIIKKICNVKRLHKVPIALLSFGERLELTPEDKKLIDLHIQETLTESELLDKIYKYEAKTKTSGTKISGTKTSKKSPKDFKSTKHIEQAVSDLSSDKLSKSDTSENLTKVQEVPLQELSLSPKENLTKVQERPLSPKENLIKAQELPLQELPLSPKEKIVSLEKEVERLKTMVSTYQERFGELNNHSDPEGNKPWLDVLLKPVF